MTSPLIPHEIPIVWFLTRHAQACAARHWLLRRAPWKSRWRTNVQLEGPLHTPNSTSKVCCTSHFDSEFSILSTPKELVRSWITPQGWTRSAPDFFASLQSKAAQLPAALESCKVTCPTITRRIEVRSSKFRYFCSIAHNEAIQAISPWRTSWFGCAHSSWCRKGRAKEWKQQSSA